MSNVVKTATALLPTIYGTFAITVYRSGDGREHAVLSIGEINKELVLVRVHSQCLTGDTFSSLRCDCGEQLRQSMKRIGEEKQGIILYLNQEGRGIGLSNKIKAYALQDKGLDTVEANHTLGFPSDARDYRIVSEILRKLNITAITLLTNNPDKVKQLQKYGIPVIKRIPLETLPNKINHYYLATKKQKMHHYLTRINPHEK